MNVNAKKISMKMINESHRVKLTKEILRGEEAVEGCSPLIPVNEQLPIILFI